MVVYRRDSHRRAVLVAVVVTALALITLDSQGSGFVSSLRHTAQDAAAPLQDVANSIVRPIQSLTGGVTSVGNLRAENRRLTKELARARGKLYDLRTEREQLDDLKSLLDLTTLED